MGPLNLSFLFSLCAASEGSRFGAWLPGLPGPGPRVTFVRTKVTKRRWGDPRPPFFAQSDACKEDARLPLNFHKASGSFVIGAVGYGLRLSPLESTAVSFLLTITCAISGEAGGLI